MENFIELALKRRSVRNFSDKQVGNLELTTILEAARIAPSSSNSQPWRFVAVRDTETIKKLALAQPLGLKTINHWLPDAPCIIVCCGELNPLRRAIAKRAVPADLLSMDIAIAVDHITLAAAEIGLGTCWIGWLSEKRVKKILGIPIGWRVLAMLAVGYPAEPLETREPNRKKLSEIAFREKQDKPWE